DLHSFPTRRSSDLERVRPGLWSIPVPIPNNPLRYVLVYAFETDAGVYLVDAGWNTDDAYETLVAGLSAVGASIGDVRGVMVTHIHPDHYDHPDELLTRVAAILRQWGAPADEIEGLTYASMPVRQFVSLVKPDVLLEDGDKPEVPGWDIQAIWTPGHSPGHLAFWEPRHRLMLTGDH